MPPMPLHNYEGMNLAILDDKRIDFSTRDNNNYSVKYSRFYFHSFPRGLMHRENSILRCQSCKFSTLAEKIFLRLFSLKFDVNFKSYLHSRFI